jgi:hypothetical protein
MAHSCPIVRIAREDSDGLIGGGLIGGEPLRSLASMDGPALELIGVEVWIAFTRGEEWLILGRHAAKHDHELLEDLAGELLA